jgi:hypothetical protein
MNKAPFHQAKAMYDNAELNSAFSERAREVWVARTSRSSRPGGLQPRLTDVRDGRRKTLILILTEELESKIQTALALGCGYRSGLQDAEKWKRQNLLRPTDNAGTPETIEHRWNVKRSEIQPKKEPTESQKGTLEDLAQNLE